MLTRGKTPKETQGDVPVTLVKKTRRKKPKETQDATPVKPVKKISDRQKADTQKPAKKKPSPKEIAQTDFFDNVFNSSPLAPKDAESSNTKDFDGSAISEGKDSESEEEGTNDDNRNSGQHDYDGVDEELAVALRAQKVASARIRELQAVSQSRTLERGGHPPIRYHSAPPSPWAGLATPRVRTPPLVSSAVAPTKRPLATITEPEDMLAAHQQKRKKVHRRQANVPVVDNGCDSELPPKASGAPAAGTNAHQLSAYSPASRGYLNVVKFEYKCLLSLECPFPGRLQGHSFTARALEAADERTDNSITVNHSLVRMMTDLASSWRGTLRQNTEKTVTNLYDLDKLNPQEKRVSIEALIAKQRFIYGKRTEGPNGICYSRPFRHPCIAQIVYDSWFASSDALAIMRPDNFSNLSFEIVAFACTMIRCSLDHYEQGTRVTKNFTEKEYRPVFDAVLNTLRNHAIKCPADMQKMRRWLRVSVDQLVADQPPGAAVEEDVDLDVGNSSD